MIKIPENAYSAQEHLVEVMASYRAGGLDFKSWKKHAAPMGVYQEREKTSFMIRPRIFNGIVSRSQLIGLARLSNEHGDGRLHLTTRQDIQLHGFGFDGVIETLPQIIKIGLINRGAGGNSIRNIACSPLSGVDPDEVFDVTEHAQKAVAYSLGLEGATDLPRKYKIGFSSSTKDGGNAGIADLGFVATVKDEQRGFIVYAGGGLGTNPRTGLRLADFIKEHEIFAYIGAMKNLFYEQGDRENHSKARIRHVVDRLGEKSFIELFNKYLNDLQQEDIALASNSEQLLSRPSLYSGDDQRVIQQKQSGYYTITFRPTNGDLNIDVVERLLELTNADKETIEFRVGLDQSLYIRNVSGNEVESLITFINTYTGYTIIDQSLTCIGAKTCRIGLTNSQGLLPQILVKLSDLSSAVKKKLPKLFVSGCKNSCGYHQTAPVGFYGKFIMTPQGRVPAYGVMIGGKIAAGDSRIAEEIGVLAARHVPSYYRAIVDHYIGSGILEFEDYLQIERDQIVKLLENYREVASIDEAVRLLDY